MEECSKKWRAETLIKYMGIDNFHVKIIHFDVFLISVREKSIKVFISIYDDDQKSDEEINTLKKHLHTVVKNLKIHDQFLIDKEEEFEKDTNTIITYHNNIFQLISKEIKIEQLPENGSTNFKINAEELEKASNKNPIQLDNLMNLRSDSPSSDIEFPMIPLAMNSNTPGINTLYPIRPSRSLSTPR
tara:strand:+ start:2245 stop:2805 length:561 start_codon:yes stop_codon:yes gene_type:complete